MRWLGTNFGNEREIKRFLILPKKINGTWRWLESAIIHQHYFGKCKWINDWWAND